MIDDYINVARSALRRRVMEVPNIPVKTRIAWMNQKFTPPVYDKNNRVDLCVWVEDHMLLGTSGDYQVAAPGTKRVSHVYQLSVRIPSLLGVDPLLRLLADIETTFKATPILLDPPGDGQTKLRINSVGMTQLQESLWWHVPVSIAYVYEA